jgi:transcription antitermination factor NusG
MESEMDKKHWLALYVKPRHEKLVATKLYEKDIEHYLPLIKQRRRWSDRWKWVEEPLFRGYVFVRIPLHHKIYALETPGVVRVVQFKGDPAIIPDYQIDAIKIMLQYPETLEISPIIHPGEEVEVVEGPFKGLRGEVVRQYGQTRFYVNIEHLNQSISVIMDEAYLKKIRKTEKSKP